LHYCISTQQSDKLPVFPEENTPASTANSAAARSNKVMDDAHKVVGDTHKVVGDLHKVVDDTHKVVGYVHKVVDDVHKVVGEAHKVVDDAAKVVGEAHKVVGVAGKAVGQPGRGVGEPEMVVTEAKKVPAPAKKAAGAKANWTCGRYPVPVILFRSYRRPAMSTQVCRSSTRVSGSITRRSLSLLPSHPAPAYSPVFSFEDSSSFLSLPLDRRSRRHRPGRALQTTIRALASSIIDGYRTRGLIHP